MLFKRIFMVGVCAYLAFPVWAVMPTEQRETPLTISTEAPHGVDPSLQAFIRQLWADNPAVAQAQAALEAARARAEGAAKPLNNPSVAFDAEHTDINTTSVGISQTFDWSGKQGALEQVAAQEVQVAEAGLEAARQHIAVEALSALVNFFTARDMQALALRRSQLMKGFIDAVIQRQSAGDVSALDVTLAQVAYSEALMAQAVSESDLAEAEAALQAVSGKVLQRWPPFPDVLAPPPEKADPSLLETLPDLAILRGRMEAARARVNLARREGRINPTIGLRAGREDTEALLGLSIEIPLFVRNNYQSAARAASHEAIAEEQALRDAYQRALARIEGALGRFENTSRAWRAWVVTGQQAQREQAALLEKMGQAGELSATEFLIQAKQNLDSLAAATGLMGEVWQAAITWLDASGRVAQWLGLANSTGEMYSGEGQ
jgi:cobalt-zinc-cadmium efflux system outer membrane protein